MDALVRRNQVDQRNSDQRENILGIQNIFVLNILKFRCNFHASSYLYIIHTLTIDRSWNYVRWDLADVTQIWNVIVSDENSFSVVSRETYITKAASSVVSERVDCWLPHRPPANIAHHDRLSTLMSHCGCAVIFQDSLWNLRGVIRSGRPCSPWKSGDMRSTTPYVSSNHPMSKCAAYNQPLESVTSTEQDHSKESFFSRVKWINTQSGYIRVRRTWNKARKCHIFFWESIITFRSH